jgi:Mrp family chromosome partitioning ATPase
MQQIECAVAKTRANGQGDVFRRKSETTSPPQQIASPKLADGGADMFTLNHRNLEANRIISWNKRDHRTPAFDVLRTKVLMTMKSNGWRTLAVTSPTEGCGKTIAAINLAFSIAHQISSGVLLVDFDLRQPRVASYLDIQPSGDLTAFLEGRGPLTTYLVTAGGARLRVLPTLDTRANATELLSQARSDALFEQVRADDDLRIGIFDLPPLLPTDDALAVIPRIDCILLIVAENVTRKTDVSEALSLLAGSNLLGVVHNLSRISFMPYY